MSFHYKYGLLLAFCMSSYHSAQAQDYAARVIGKKRYANDAGGINPNASATPPPSNNSFIEEDLTGPSNGTKRNIKVAPPPKSPSFLAPAEAVEPEPVKPSPRSKSLPSEAWDPRGSAPSESSSTADTGREHAGDIDDDGGVGISANIGFGSRSFSAGLGLSFPIYRWLAWNISGSYYTAVKDEDKEVKYGPEASLMLRIPSRIPITPFAGVGVGYEKWSRFRSEIIFDDAASLLSLYYVGISIPMAKHLAISISQTWKTYLGRPPRTFDDAKIYEPYSSKTLNIGLAVVF